MASEQGNRFPIEKLIKEFNVRSFPNLQPIPFPDSKSFFTRLSEDGIKFKPEINEVFAIEENSQWIVYQKEGDPSFFAYSLPLPDDLHPSSATTTIIYDAYDNKKPPRIHITGMANQKLGNFVNESPPLVHMLFFGEHLKNVDIGIIEDDIKGRLDYPVKKEFPLEELRFNKISETFENTVLYGLTTKTMLDQSKSSHFIHIEVGNHNHEMDNYLQENFFHFYSYTDSYAVVYRPDNTTFNFPKSLVELPLPELPELPELEIEKRIALFFGEIISILVDEQSYPKYFPKETADEILNSIKIFESKKRFEILVKALKKCHLHHHFNSIREQIKENNFPEGSLGKEINILPLILLGSVILETSTEEYSYYDPDDSRYNELESQYVTQISELRNSLKKLKERVTPEEFINAILNGTFKFIDTERVLERMV